MSKQKKVFKNAGRLMQTRHSCLEPLRQKEMQSVPYLENAYLLVDADGRIEAFGTMEDYNLTWDNGREIVDLENDWLWPGWIDSHTHTVFPYYRSDEFEKRLKGFSYQQIAKEGGGILNTARNLEQYTEDQLFESALLRLNKMISKGTVAVEIKTGYGLNWEGEIKMLKVIQRLKAAAPIPVKSTLLAAHALPLRYNGDTQAYIDWICEDLLPHCVENAWIDYIDIFCETGYFSAKNTQQLLSVASRYGVKAKIHTNQFTSIGGIQEAIEQGALSVDHLEVMNEQDISDLATSSTLGCLLPIAPFFLNDPYPLGRSMLDEGCALCLATDFNPGSAPQYDMALAISLACLKCGLLPAEAINAATINAAFALEIQDTVGSISVGKWANLCRTSPMKGISDIPYRICSEYLEDVIIKGEFWRS